MLQFKLKYKPFIDGLTETKEQIKRNVASESFEILEIVNKHTEPKVPLETGRLRASVMRRNGMLIENDFMTQEIEYSARNPKTGYDYAFIQHETPPHIYHHRVGQWKYLEDGLSESENEIYRLIEREVDLAIKQGD